MKHVNEDKLIQYAFDLLETEQQNEIARHLEQCPDCRTKMEQIQKQFAVLDVLNEDAALSEELIQQTLAQKAAGAKTIRFYRRLWVEWTAAAAAVLLICALLLQNLPDTHVKEPAPRDFDKPVAKLDTKDNRPSLTAIPPSQGGESEDSPPVKGQYPEGGRGYDSESIKNSMGTAHPTIHDVKIVSADAIPDVAPFAPASAIELVVLPNPDKMQLTIYNSADLTLVRDTRRLTLKPGWNWLQFMWDGTLIDPTSLSLVPLQRADKIDIQQLVYPARLKDIGRWLIRSEVEGSVPFEITYFASGLSWRAFYMGTMNADETSMNLKGYVNVANNSGQDFENAQTRLVVGETHLLEEIPYLAQRHYPYGPEIMKNEKGVSRYNWHGVKDFDKKIPMLGDMPGLGGRFYDYGADNADKLTIKQIEKEGLSEYFLYTIEGTEDLPNTWAKRLPSFDVDNIPVKSLYKYDEDRYARQTVRFVSFKNDAEHKLGETPIPEGAVKIYRNLNDMQNLSYIGGSSLKYIPVNEDVELNLGPDQLVKVEPVLMNTQTDNYIFDNKGNITGSDTIETWKLKLTNTRDIPVEIEITRNFGTDYWDIELNNSPPAKGEYPEGGRGSIPTYKKHDKNRARFTITLSPRTETSFAYTVTNYQGQRAEAYVKKLQEQQK
ncbi:MAG: DUF4139 domain-containing protein [Phycisphaerae bacterium]|nr:DUF4139 domain-containing protein [Phycisphaerae bacterium]